MSPGQLSFQYLGSSALFRPPSKVYYLWWGTELSDERPCLLVLSLRFPSTTFNRPQKCT
ncbi:hypothetical protein C8Q79DRAFT_950647 [Trametes meyenii]|nr:hypothetical protein C8Q79DRAFT_950647 [Trametes meyenii]